MDEVIGYVNTRAAEVATDAIASDIAQVHQDMLDADADASAAAASAAAAAGTLANAVKKTGEASQSIAGDIIVSGAVSVGSLGVGAHAALVDATVSGHISVPAPTANSYAANKKYVDDKDALDVHLAGNETIADVKTFSSSPIVPTVATGTADTKAANGTKVKNELDNYAPMIRTTGNQTKSGILTLSSNLNLNKNSVGGPFIQFLTTYDPANPAAGETARIETYDKDNNLLHYIAMRTRANGGRSMSFTITNPSGGTNAYFNLDIAADGTMSVLTNFPKPSNW